MIIKTKIVSSPTVDSKPVKQEVNCTAILPPLVIPGPGIGKQCLQFALLAPLDTVGHFLLDGGLVLLFAEPDGDEGVVGALKKTEKDRFKNAEYRFLIKTPT